MDFEWNEKKRDANLTKHSIDFVDAISIWQGDCIDLLARRLVSGEERFLALGAIGDEHFVVAVVYSYRNGVRRIISARRARRNERQTYKGAFGKGR